MYVDTVISNGAVTIEVEQGQMTVETVKAGAAAALIAQGSIVDAFADALAPTVNVTAAGNLYLEAGEDVGSAGNFFDVLVGGDLSGLWATTPSSTPRRP